MRKLQNNTLYRTLRRGRPALALVAAVAVLAALALAALTALLPHAVPGAQAQEYRTPVNQEEGFPIERIVTAISADTSNLVIYSESVRWGYTLWSPDPTYDLVYPGTQTHIRAGAFQAVDAVIDDDFVADVCQFAPWLCGTSLDASDYLIQVPLPNETVFFWEGADAEACAIIQDADCSGIPGTWGPDWRMIWIPIREDAPAGDYRIKLTTQAQDADGNPEATETITITVIGPPRDLRARVRAAYAPGDQVRGSATVYDADGNLATFTPHPGFGHGVPQRCEGCLWKAADDPTAAALVIPQGRVSSGAFRARLKADAAPGTYRIRVYHPRGGTQTVSFTVVDDTQPADPGPTPTPAPGEALPPVVPPGPASYTLAGQSAIEAGMNAIYTVTAANEDGSRPNLEGANAKVYVLVDGPGQDAVTLTGVSAADGAITLNDQGAGIFTVQVAAGALPSTVSLEVVGAIDTDPVIRQLTIGTAAVPDGLGDVSNLTLTAGTGDAAGSVTLRWTPGDNADRHWVAGVKVSDWNIRDFSNIIWTRAASNNTHTVTGLEAGAEYAFTVIPVRLVNGVTEWGSWAPIERVTVSAPAAAPQ